MALAARVPHSRRARGTIMRKLRDVEVTIIDIDSDGDGTSDEELVIVEDVDI
jgi:hypothetical protein